MCRRYVLSRPRGDWPAGCGAGTHISTWGIGLTPWIFTLQLVFGEGQLSALGELARFGPNFKLAFLFVGLQVLDDL